MTTPPRALEIEGGGKRRAMEHVIVVQRYWSLSSSGPFNRDVDVFLFACTETGNAAAELFRKKDTETFKSSDGASILRFYRYDLEAYPVVP